MDTYLGNICVFGFNFAPAQWATCSGQLLSTAQYQALFSLIGTSFGGDGKNTFALPNLQNKTAVGTSIDKSYPIGGTGGKTQVTLSTNNLPPHTHSLSVQVQVSRLANLTDPTANFPGATDGTSNAYNSTEGTTGVAMAPATVAIQPVGGTDPVNVQSPYLGMLYCISIGGSFPPRS